MITPSQYNLNSQVNTADHSRPGFSVTALFSVSGVVAAGAEVVWALSMAATGTTTGAAAVRNHHRYDASSSGRASDQTRLSNSTRRGSRETCGVGRSVS